MAREIRIERDGPYEVTPQPKSVWICGCGLSRNLPYCDGSHAQARQEEPGKLCRYRRGAGMPPLIEDDPSEHDST